MRLEMLSGIGKHPVLARIAEQPGMRHLSITMVVGSERITCETPLVWVGVGWGSFPFVHESPDERAVPEIEIVIMRPGSRLGAILMVLRMALFLRDREQAPSGQEKSGVTP